MLFRSAINAGLMEGIGDGRKIGFGLFRVREFTQDDSHIFCTQDQIKDVIFEVLEFVDSLLLYDF